jgi:iron complex transport system permease protein
VIGRWIAAVTLLLGAIILSLGTGSTAIAPAELLTLLGRGFGAGADSQNGQILWLFRVPKALVAIMAGSALSVSGLQMQTLFRNPLADPFVLGVSAGASLGAALVIVLGGWWLGTWGLVGAAFAGAMGTSLLVVWVAHRLRQSQALLIFGLLLGYAIAAVLAILLQFGAAERIQRFVLWSSGSFGGVTWRDLPTMAIATGLGHTLALTLAQPLNVLLLGEAYAQSLGMAVGPMRLALILNSTLLAATTTAFCGPISFIGIAVPHLSAGLLKTGDRRLLIPFCALIGAALALGSDSLTQILGGGIVLPLNAITALLGTPIVIGIILRSAK